jgi:hypothetical protein
VDVVVLGIDGNVDHVGSFIEGQMMAGVFVSLALLGGFWILFRK